MPRGFNLEAENKGMKKLKKTLRELKAKEEKTRKELREIIKVEDALMINIWSLENDLRIGNKVRFDKDGIIYTGILNIIIQYGKAQPAIKLFKKNGEIGTRVIDYNIENIKKID